MRQAALIFAVLFLASCGAKGEKPGQPAFDAIGADQRVQFLGTEPFWGGEVTGDTLLYSTPENPAGTAVAVTRFAGNNGVSYSGTLDGRKLDLMITPGTCSDGMSDREYPYVATMEIDGAQRDGCAFVGDRDDFGGDAFKER